MTTMAKGNRLRNKTGWTETPPKYFRNTRRMRPLIEKRQTWELWTQKHVIIPRLVDRVFGDGRRLLRLFPVMMRPQHFVVRMDSAIDIQHGGDWLDDIYDATEEEFIVWPWYRAYGLLASADRESERSATIEWSDGSCWEESRWPHDTHNHR